MKKFKVDLAQAKILNEIEKRKGSKLHLVKKVNYREEILLRGMGNPDQLLIENNKVVGLRITSNEDVEELIGNITTLKRLDFQKPLHTIPASFKNLKDLEILILKNCGIKKITNLEKFAMLKELDLSSNEITEIKNLDNCELLEWLDLSYNKIITIEGLNNLPNLERLKLDYNKINEISGLDSLFSLTDLGLFGNLYTEIKGLENLTNLWFIEIRGSKLPKNLIASIVGGGNHRTQAYKFVNYCQNKKVAQENLKKQFVIYQDKKFYVWNRILRLKQEGIVAISQIKGLKSITDVDTLDLSYNNISEIKGLDHLIGVKELRLNDNKIDEIEGLDSLNALEVFDISSTNIREIKGLDALKNLKRLTLTHNKINEIKNIGHLVKLEFLSIDTSDQFWEDLKVKMGEDFYNEIGMRGRGHHIKNPQKVVEYCKIIDNEKDLLGRED